MVGGWVVRRERIIAETMSDLLHKTSNTIHDQNVKEGKPKRGLRSLASK